LLRQGPIEEEQLKEKIDLEDSLIQKHLKKLEKSNIVIRIQDKKKHSHLLLKCNPEVLTVYPEWLIQRTVDLYNAEELVPNQAIHYLEVLKRSHPSQIEILTMESE
jgi:DNA-binding transcriptional ArsR family regulator